MNQKPRFFWQGVLILLPVAVMAGFGFWAIVRERNAVEADAKQRAVEIINSIPEDFGRAAAFCLTQPDAQKNGWFNYLRWGLAAWPGDTNRNIFLFDTNEIAAIHNNLAGLRSDFPDWSNGPPPLVELSLGANGQILDRNPPIPQPPQWLANLSRGQYGAWVALESADETHQPLSPLLVAFDDLNPPGDAKICARFIELGARLRNAPASNAIDALNRFAGENYTVESASGLPLTTLALAESLRRARECGPTESLWKALISEVTDPTALTGNLIDEAGALVATNADLARGVDAMRILLADEQAQQELADAISQTVKLDGILTTNLWLDAQGRRWFCILQPDNLRSGTIVSNKPVWKEVPYTRVSCYPKTWVEKSLIKALADARAFFPAYFGVSVEVEGERLSGPATNTLTTRDFRMYLPAIMLKPGGKPEDGAQFESMPSHPHFAVGIYLADRNLLYARQRQLQWIFGSLIALSAGTAVVGFIAALRSFRRQEELSRLKTNFVSSVSHELRAPIASVRLMAENLEGGKIPDAPRQHECFRFIVQECRRLSSLIENVLDFSRIEQGRKEYEFEQTDLAALAKTTVQLMEPYAMEKGVALKLNSPGNGVEAVVDGRALQQALVNLIDNAVKHSAKGQFVSVGLEARNGSIQFSVADDGPGIPPGEHEKIFERFYRLGSELRRETQGVGIGLSVVKHIVEAHRGRVIVQSEPGRGSRFLIELPARN